MEADEVCPFRLTVARERVEVLAECLGAMPMWARELILRHYVDGVSLAGIARTAGVDVRTVYKWHRRAIRGMRRELAARSITRSVDI